MTPKNNTDFNRMRAIKENAETPPSPRTNDAYIPLAAAAANTTTASSSANCSFDEAGSARTSLSRNAMQ